MRIRTTVLLAILLMLIAVNAKTLPAQSGTSSALTGSINDATGAVVPNATVKATEVSTGAARTARSNAAAAARHDCRVEPRGHSRGRDVCTCDPCAQ